jgi:hypothetical protein
LGTVRKKNQLLLGGDDLRQFVERARLEMETKTAAVDAIVHLDEVSWSVDQDVGTIVFQRQDGIQAAAPVQIVGTFNTVDLTWLWAWDNPSVNESLKHGSMAVLDYGLQKDIPVLTTRKVECTEEDCLDFTALACKLSDAQCAFAGGAGTARVFMTFGQLTMSASKQRQSPP